jgi:hypothetical protein
MSQNILGEDFVTQDDFAATHNVNPRTIARYRREPAGLPFTVFGGKIWIHVPGAREWLAKRIRSNSRRVA